MWVSHWVLVFWSLYSWVVLLFFSTHSFPASWGWGSPTSLLHRPPMLSAHVSTNLGVTELCVCVCSWTSGVWYVLLFFSGGTVWWIVICSELSHGATSVSGWVSSGRVFLYVVLFVFVFVMRVVWGVLVS